MQARSKVVGAVAVVIACLVFAAPAAAAPEDHDFSATALNIIPSGQYGDVPIPAGADQQALMYDGLTPLFDQVTDADLTTFFKSERFGVADACPCTNEAVPRPGVTLTRDSYNVPHIEGATDEDGIWAAGWVTAEDRGLLLEQARYNARVAAIDVPGVTAIGLIAGLKTFTPSAATEAELAKQTDVLNAAGPEGQAVLADIDTFVAGINAYRAAEGINVPEWTRNDIYAVNALKGQFLGQGGGDEARRTQFLAGLQKANGTKKGKKIFDDVRQFTNKELPTSIDGKFPYGAIPSPKKAKGNVIIDPGSYESTPAIAPDSAGRPTYDDQQASNTLMVDSARSATGNPLMVGGPQIGYFYPGFTLEMDMHTPGMDWRGATSIPFPGYLLIGRGPDFATTLTSASGDIIDQYAEKLCGGSDTKYKYKGQCLDMETVDAGTIATANGPQPVTFQRTVHGPVVGYATVKGKKVAISSKRSSYGKDVLDQLFFRRLSNGQVSSPETFFDAAALTPQTFNSFYIDHQSIAEFTSGLLPLRKKSLDPGLLADGSGKYEWKGFLSTADHPQGINPKDGTITNWNQTVAKGFAAADDEFGRNGSVARTDLLDIALDKLAAGGKWTLASVTAAMNKAATQDVRAIVTVPLLKKLLKGSKGSAQAKQMLSVLVGWKNAGGSRLDRDLDGKIDDPGAAVIDGSWDLIANAFMKPRIKKQLDELDSLFSRFHQPPGGQYSGWYQYFDRDIRSLLGKKVKQPFNLAYCGKGDLEKCQASIWKALKKAGKQISAAQGTTDPAAWRADANAERIEFQPGLLTTTMRYTNRPSGIQQVITFNGHR